MASVNLAVVLLLIMAFMSQVIDAVVYKVGDSAGWTTIGNVDYKQWAATKTFQVGDVIVFEYNSQFHNVMRVTHEMYKTCNASAPLATYTTGNDSITIKTRGHHFFFCGVPGHCQAGQKIDINVPRNDQEMSPSPSASASASQPSTLSPPVPAARVPGPSSNQAVLIKPFISIAVLGIFVFSFA
ncbi:hypothetical protein JCGZ_02152 [Jatropha curcas]|uniref:Phytocyanin domain-containing protein n=1 Tax=Jatropha curcas TaxID=180498 RepID=A0A067L7U8_JATCU|nr:mavicyanin [Jatropha curcas]KDP40154.1 hypothetical protein JCGZ_02152 [Jatropha curcas]